MLPELVYTMLITIFYVIILKVNQRLETLEKGASKFV